MGYSKIISEVLFYNGEAQSITTLSSFNSVRFYRSACGLLVAVIQLGDSFKDTLEKVTLVDKHKNSYKTELVVQDYVTLDSAYRVFCLD